MLLESKIHVLQGFAFNLGFRSRKAVYASLSVVYGMGSHQIGFG